MTLSAGSLLGPYEILAPLGAGGMGEVYRARDTRLSREVAIKVLPAELVSDASRLKRFEKEARSASALNHPNIVTIYDIGSDGGVSYIAMERVEGATLRELLVGGPLSTRRLLPIATQIAEGLAKAHEAGMVHRDLKRPQPGADQHGVREDHPSPGAQGFPGRRPRLVLSIEGLAGGRGEVYGAWVRRCGHNDAMLMATGGDQA